MRTVIKKGPADWGDLIGKTFEFRFYPEWEDPEWVEIALYAVYSTHNEFGTPIYYLLDSEGGGYMQYDSAEVEVIVHD